MAQSRWRWFLRRGLAVVAALFLLLLLGSGLLLNHGAGLGLAQAPVESRWLRHLYGMPVVAEAGAGEGLVHPLPAGDLAAREGQLRLGEKSLGECPRLVGIVEQAGQVLAVCSNSLILLTPEGVLLDQASALRGIPDGLSAVTRQGDEVLLRQGETTFSVNLGDLSVAPARSGSAGPGPGVAMDASATPDLTWERVLRDVHGGRLFGRYGPWVVDAVTVLIAVLAGLALFRRPRA